MGCLKDEIVDFIKDKQGGISERLADYINELAFYDRLYLYALYQKFWEKRKNLKIGQNFIPSALLTDSKRTRELGVVNYSQLKKDSSLTNFAKEVVLVCNPMDGGLGSSLSRIEYLRRIWTEIKRKGNPHLGAKGQDLYFEIATKDLTLQAEKTKATEKLSVTEIKYLQTIKESDFYKKIIIEELVNEDSIGSINEFLDKTIYFQHRIDNCTNSNKLTYRELISAKEKIELSEKMIKQASLPTIEKNSNRLTVERVAPGGHGQLGSMLLGQAAEAKAGLPKNLIRVIYNGDGPNNFPDRKIVGFMAKHNIPLLMVTSTKTPIDQKGGQIGLEVTENKKKKTQILELAQAEYLGQGELFKKIGLKSGNLDTYGKVGKQYFNTNIALINYSVVSPFLKELYDLIGARKFSKIVTPDLIKNEKIQDNKAYIQLEGALASALLNLAGFIKTTRNKKIGSLIKKYGIDNFLVIVNIEKDERANFFTPVKYAWDFWFYAFSDRFKLNSQNFKLEDLRAGNLPGFDLDSFYQNLENCIKAFGKASTFDLTYLAIKGKVFLKDAVLSGSVIINNRAKGSVDLNSKSIKNNFDLKGGRLYLNNIKITIEKNKEINTEKTAAG